jgi:hypothetical protein
MMVASGMDVLAIWVLSLDDPDTAEGCISSPQLEA